MRLEVVNKMQIEILNVGEILVNWSKSRNSNSSVSRGTNSNWDFDCLWIPLYLAVHIQIENWICSWLKNPHHSGFRLTSLTLECKRGLLPRRNLQNLVLERSLDPWVVSVRRWTEFAKCKQAPWKTWAHLSVNQLSGEFHADFLKRDPVIVWSHQS